MLSGSEGIWLTQLHVESCKTGKNIHVVSDNMANFLPEKNTYTCMIAFKPNFKHSTIQTFKMVATPVEVTIPGPKRISDCMG